MPKNKYLPRPQDVNASSLLDIISAMVISAVDYFWGKKSFEALFNKSRWLILVALVVMLFGAWLKKEAVGIARNHRRTANPKEEKATNSFLVVFSIWQFLLFIVMGGFAFNLITHEKVNPLISIFGMVLLSGLYCQLLYKWTKPKPSFGNQNDKRIELLNMLGDVVLIFPSTFFIYLTWTRWGYNRIFYYNGHWSIDFLWKLPLLYVTAYTLLLLPFKTFYIAEFGIYKTWAWMKKMVLVIIIIGTIKLLLQMF